MQLFPEVKDVSNISARYSQTLFLPIGVEGQADAGGTAVLGRVYAITRPSEADTYFGSASSLSLLIKFLLNRGVGLILGVASVKSATPPTLTQRQTAWQSLESDVNVRLRMTDDTAQATHVALAQSCGYAALIYNKQIGFGGLAAGTSKATLLSAASAMSNSRFVLVAPGIYDSNGSLLSGNYAAAAVAAEVSKNSDISDDLDTAVLPNLTGIELDANGMPIFRQKIVSGVPQNDLEDLLQGGVSPLMATRSTTGAQISHLRTTFTTDSTFDALMTRLIVDQVFLDVREYVISNNYLRRGNTLRNRTDLRAGVQALLSRRDSWINPLTQSDGELGYNVSVVPSNDFRQVIIGYEGVVVRGIQTILVDAKLSIPV